MRAISLVALSLLSVGCANTDGYSAFYLNDPNAATALANRATPPSKSPLVTHETHFDGLGDVYARKGYAVIGYSSFTSGYNQSDKDAIKQAMKIGADLVVIIDPKYDRSTTAAIPVTTPTTSTSRTNSTATAYGTGGTATAFGDSTTTTYGNSTTYVPMTVDRYSYGALFLIKYHFVFGAQVTDLSNDERHMLQTNRGVHVTSIVDGTPAFNSDVLPGDIIIAIDGNTVNGTAGFEELISTNKGRTIKVTITRQDKVISKSIALLE